MEVLRRLLRTQEDYEDALRMEIDYADVRDTKEGKQLLKWIRARRKAVEKLIRNYE
jgi:hypothetical protein